MKTSLNWDVICRPKELGGLRFGKTSLRNHALLRKWLWRFSRESSGLWHQVIASIYRTYPNGWDVNMVVRWSYRCTWKAIVQVFFRISPHISVLWWGMGRESVFGKIFRNNLCVHISLVFIELFIWKTSPFQLSLTILIHSLGILTFATISLM